MITIINFSNVVLRLILVSLFFFTAVAAEAQVNQPLAPLLRTVDMNVGETVEIKLHDGSITEVELLAVDPVTDTVAGAVREVKVTVRVKGKEKTLSSGNYNLPVNAGGVQIDCPVTRDYTEKAHMDWWGLEKDVRLRLWPAGSPYIWPGTFVYPVDQRWLASFTQYSNEPVVGTPRADGSVYYHAGLDLGGAEDMVEVYAATDGVVVSVRGEVLPGEPEEPISPRYDVVYIRDARGWFYRYSHFDSIVPDLQVGQRVRAGQKLGMLGKEGGSGGWSHLHFEIVSKQPSGLWGTQEGYAFLWQAYQRQHNPEILAVARPHKVIQAGETATLSAGNSWAKNEIDSYEWTLSDGSTRDGEEIQQSYSQPGTYSEIVKVSDREGNYDYDFAVVKVFEEGSDGTEGLPDIHAAFYPTQNIAPGDKVFFQVRSRWTTEGYDVWDFDDGSAPATVKSNIETDNHARVGYSTTSHRFDEPGDYLVKVQRETSRGTATAHLYVRVRH
ncbi:PKD domain-containing protein [Fodinibius sp.]|uniref:PKD domain-containing protein n=1 Tax=Fodinibius sp. TaxID=1872440 RepID=UPI003565A279